METFALDFITKISYDVSNKNHTFHRSSHEGKESSYYNCIDRN